MPGLSTLEPDPVVGRPNLVSSSEKPAKLVKGFPGPDSALLGANGMAPVTASFWTAEVDVGVELD